MSRIKEFYHEEICQGIDEMILSHIDDDYFYQKETKNCDGYKISNCCGDSLINSDVCCNCGEHAEPSCVNCETHCSNYKNKF